jgi:VWFA-related protein
VSPRPKTAIFSLVLVSLLAALVTASGAGAGVRLNGVDLGAYPTVRATVVTSTPTVRPPALTENGAAVPGLSAVNLGRCKNVVLALDNSRSMAGKPLAEAASAAASFVSSKAGCDRVSLVTFGKTAVQQSRFSTATIDADNALRALAVSKESGTALWDAVELSARVLGGTDGGKVVVLLTDGDDVGSTSNEQGAMTALHKAGAVAYPIAFGPKADASALERIASSTGGSFHRASDSSALKEIYASIASELKRTWRVSYSTAGRPGDALAL